MLFMKGIELIAYDTIPNKIRDKLLGLLKETIYDFFEQHIEVFYSSSWIDYNDIYDECTMYATMSLYFSDEPGGKEEDHHEIVCAKWEVDVETMYIDEPSFFTSTNMNDYDVYGDGDQVTCYYNGTYNFTWHILDS